MIIDSHHHFWNYSVEEYGWIDDSMSAIARSFTPSDLKAEIDAVGIDGVVSVQARQTVEETEWLLQLAEANNFIKGVVGWVPLAEENVGDTLASFTGRKKLKAVRHVVQDEPDNRFIMGDDFNRGVAQLADLGLVYDILIFERQLPASIEFVDRHPNQSFVLDHIAKPKIADAEIEPWKDNFFELAKRENVVCKLSGMVTEDDWKNWSLASLRPYLDAALEAFGPDRLMFGSDWPPCLLACGYADWYQLIRDWAAPLSDTEKANLLGNVAIRAYHLDD